MCDWVKDFAQTGDLSAGAKKSPRKAVGGELYLSLTKQNYLK